jgi:hypothetical protein
MSTGLCPQACSTVLLDSSHANVLTQLSSLQAEVSMLMYGALTSKHKVISAVVILQIFCCAEPVHQQLHRDIGSRLPAD